MVVSRDRTNELSQLFDELKRQHGGRSEHAITAPTVRHVSEFHRAAQDITGELTSTAEMLENLSKLTRQNSAFDDHSQEVNQMTLVVKERMSNLHEKILHLGQLKDSSRQWGQTQANTHTDTVVKTLKTQLVGSQKAFKDILTCRTQNMKQVSDRRSKFTHSGEREFTSSIFRNARREEEEEALMPVRSSGQQVALQTQDSSMQYYRQRQEGVKMIEETISQLGSLFQDFSRLVAEQEEMIQRIDQNTEDAVDNVQKGQDFLLKYLTNISSNRSLIFKVFGILFVFVLVFGLFVVK
eukprot:TRINITY_DN35709_c0_g1_i1.p1 TRINITY_DN35709_c0_g1~~TRINITY_DN35709_c0_g1_i1.p1  ORF type:complete len:296 (+),score=128.44 TRINITY_DN35709_c0_g1_i1:158-1045(+)